MTGGAQRPPWHKRWTRNLGYPVQYPLLAEGKVFVAAGPRLSALDGATGDEVWSLALGPSEPNPRSFAAYGDGRVFAAFREGPLRAFDAATGKELWSKDFRPFDNLDSPPVYSEGVVYTVSGDSGLRALSATTGRELWSGWAGNAGHSLPPTIAGGRAFAVASCNWAFAYDSFTGARLWSSPGRCTGGMSLGSAVTGGRLWAEGDGTHTPLVFDAATGKVTGAFSGSLPAFDDKRTYVLDGAALKARDLETQFTQWTFLGDGQLGTPPRCWWTASSTSARGRGGCGLSTRAQARRCGRTTPASRSHGPSWQLFASVGANIVAGQGMMVVPASNRVVAYEPATPGPTSVDRPVAWGWNPLGQLGDGTTADRLRPVALGGLADAVDVAAGAFHSLALRTDGTVWATGWNGFGQLGDGTTALRTTPVQVKGLTDVVAVTAGVYHSVALQADDTVWAWGWNGMGQLGDGTVAQRLTPVAVGGLSDVASISAGALHTLAVKKDGTLWAWGWNGVGQLGDATYRSATARSGWPRSPTWLTWAEASTTPWPSSGTGRCGPGAGTSSASWATPRRSTGPRPRW